MNKKIRKTCRHWIFFKFINLMNTLAANDAEMDLWCHYNVTIELIAAITLLKRENHPVEANRSQTLSSVRLVATHRWINRFVCLAFTYVRYVQRISAGHAGPAVSFDEFSLFVPPTRLCRSLASSPRAVFILQHVASFFFFFLFPDPFILDSLFAVAR